MNISPKVKVQALVSYTETINTIKPPDPNLTVAFDFSPHQGPYFYVAGDTTYFPPNTYLAPTGDPITFTATVTIPSELGSLSVAEYHWDFGDETFAYGNPVEHTYQIPNLQTQVVLRVTDSRGLEWFTRKQIYLSGLASPIMSAPILVTTP